MIKNIDEGQQEVIEQIMVTLPYLDDKVPALVLEDRKLYIPVYLICQALGIRADVHIRRWRELVFWITARKLPLLTEKRGKRLVWCLLISEVPFLYSLFNWELVSQERRQQLRQASKEHMKLIDLAYQELQQSYKSIRLTLFTFLTNFADFDERLQRLQHRLSLTLDNRSSLALNVLIYSGSSLVQKISTHARKMLRDQGNLPIIDTFQLDINKNVIDSYSMPLLPIVPDEDTELFFALLEELTSWILELQTLCSEQK